MAMITRWNRWRSNFEGMILESSSSHRMMLLCIGGSSCLSPETTRFLRWGCFGGNSGEGESLLSSRRRSERGMIWSKGRTCQNTISYPTFKAWRYWDMRCEWIRDWEVASGESVYPSANWCPKKVQGVGKEVTPEIVIPWMESIKGTVTVLITKRYSELCRQMDGNVELE